MPCYCAKVDHCSGKSDPAFLNNSVLFSQYTIRVAFLPRERLLVAYGAEPVASLVERLKRRGCRNEAAK